uniref:serine O-acetyltransferase n=1 Tax=unclassified Rhodococcus (in: high G+C Gram-positive bacteria) TaxID=192944 RepID=UPI00113FEB49
MDSTTDSSHFWPSWRNLCTTVREDWNNNSRNPKIQFSLALFRFCQVLMGDREKRRLVALPFVAIYRFVTEIVIGFELRPKTIVGPGISIHHAFGLVVNDGAIIGRNVQLRNGVTIGHKRTGTRPPRIGDGVEIGANAVIIGDIHIGSGSKVGAGAVVVKSCEANSVLVGNPASNVAGPQAGPTE